MNSEILEKGTKHNETCQDCPNQPLELFGFYVLKIGFHFMPEDSEI